MGSAHSSLANGGTVIATDDTANLPGAKAGFKGLTAKGGKKNSSKQQPGGLASNGSTPGSAAAAGSSFLAWAKRQSKQRNRSLKEFLVESAQLQDTAAVTAAPAPAPASPAKAKPTCAGPDHADVLGLQDVLDVLACEQQQQQQAPALQDSTQQQQGTAAAAACLAPFQPHDGYVKGPPKPHCHEARVVAADGIQALRRTRDGELESMLRLLCKVFDVETATVALLTGHAIYITAACGALQSCICPDRWGFCGWSFLNSHHELLVVEDMDQDSRFAANFFVCDPTFSLKFYVAAPLISSNGHRLGTLCVMGQQARRFDAVQGQVLANLAEMLVRQLEEKWVMSLQSAGEVVALRRATSCYASSYLVLDLSSRPWRVLHMNEPAVQETGASWGASYAELACYAEGRRDKAPFEGMALDSLFDVSRAQLTWTSPGTWEFTLSGLTLLAPGSSSTRSSLEDGCSSGSNAGGVTGSSGSNGSSRRQRYSLTCRPAASDGLDEDQPFFVGVPSWLALSDSNQWGRNYFFARLEPEQQQQQQQQLQPQRVFTGDSVEQLTPTGATGAAGSPCKTGGSDGSAAAAAAAVGSSGSNVSSGGIDSSPLFLPADLPSPAAAAAAAAVGPADDFFWLPRGHAASTGSSTGSTAGSSATSLVPSAAPSSPLSSSRSLGSFQLPGGRSSSSFDRGSSSARLSKVPPSVVSVATSSSGSSGVTGVSSAVGSLVRGLPIPGLVMGPLLGRGSYGRVYRGLLKGRPVAVKIIDDVTSLRLNAAGEPLEISLTRDLRQTGVMSTLGYAYADAAATPSYSRRNSSSSSSSAAAGGGSRRSSVDRGRGLALGGGGGRAGAASGGTRTCWMLFEYCDKGVLVDAAIRGWFRTQRNPLAGAPHLRVIGLTALEVAAAMQHLHAKNVLHGDLCGGNVMLTSSSTAPHGFAAKVGDFGLVRTAAVAASKDAAADAGGKGQQAVVLHPVEQRLANNAYGTITHQPPEVLLEGSAAFTAAADVYAWGVLLWELLTGSRAWAGLPAPSVVVQVAVLKRSLAIPPALPPVLHTLLAGALNPDPLLRPSFDEVVTQLTAFVQQSRAVDWEAWQGAADAAHADQVAAIKAAEAAADAAFDADADAAGEGQQDQGRACDAAAAAGAVSTGVACGSCPLAGRARDGVPA